ncbi:MAG: aminoglycoside phosphotransferase family protein [Ktedonobacterales bacterium]|nr:aminoglycoside phosphotransferase family protein [Ktedonobacterales bacterium]
MREKPTIAEDALRDCLANQWGLTDVQLDFLPLGLDTRAGVYRVTTATQTYLLKVKAGALYAPTCVVPHYLHQQGIAAVVAPVPTRADALWTEVAGWAVILYPFIVGVSDWDPGLTPDQWWAMGAALRQIHQTPIPVGGFATMRREAFEPARYRDHLQELMPQLSAAEDGDPLADMVRTSWRLHHATIQAALVTMAALAQRLREQATPYVICHADLHPGNIIRGSADSMHVIDWDDVMLAPQERDFLFTGEPAADTPFMQGYGTVAVDWAALTYYRWERVLQDLIECAQCVFVRADVTMGVKAEQAQLFSDILMGGGEVASAQQAAAHIPPEG